MGCDLHSPRKISNFALPMSKQLNSEQMYEIYLNGSVIGKWIWSWTVTSTASSLWWNAVRTCCWWRNCLMDANRCLSPKPLYGCWCPTGRRLDYYTNNGPEFAAHEMITKRLHMKGKEDVTVYLRTLTPPGRKDVSRTPTNWFGNTSPKKPILHGLVTRELGKYNTN